MNQHLYLGIDFSGDHLRWRPGTARSNVWIAKVVELRAGLELRDLRRVQELPNDAIPFDRLARLLQPGRFRAAAIDAPFSIPHEFLGARSHLDLLAEVAALASRARSCQRRPFPDAKTFVRAVAGQERCEPAHPLRATERQWRQQQVPTRSTLWCGCRGGAPMTAACLTLLHIANRPIWPWADASRPGLLVEAFPAAQLCHWGLPHDRYNGPAHLKRRRQLIHELEKRLGLPSRFRKAMLASADALDAVICAFAARAVSCGALARLPPTNAPADEGWISVHSAPPPP